LVFLLLNADAAVLLRGNARGAESALFLLVPKHCSLQYRLAWLPSRSVKANCKTSLRHTAGR